MKIRTVKIVNVDMDGLTGRDLHPQKSHEGMTGTVVFSYMLAIDGMLSTRNGDVKSMKAMADLIANGGEVMEIMTVVLGDRSMLELADYEVEEVDRVSELEDDVQDLEAQVEYLEEALEEISEAATAAIRRAGRR